MADVSSPLVNFDPEGYFLACEHCQKMGHILMTEIATTEHTGLTDMQRPVTQVKVTLSKFRFDFTIA